MKNPNSTAKLASLIVLGALIGSAHAQDFPTKPIRIVVPLGPGSGMDSGTRVFAEAFSKITGQPVFVENKPGAATGIGVVEVLKSPADGHTLLSLTNATLTINPVLGEKLNYDPKDLRPVAAGTRGAAVLAVGPNSPYKTLAELISAAGQNREVISIAEYGQAYRLGALRLEKQAAVKFGHIPYKSPAEASTNTIGGQVDATFIEMSGAIPLLKGGKLRALAQTGLTRSAMLPDVPTIAESGFPDFSIYIWSGFAVSAKTPDAVVKNLEAAILKTLAQNEFRKFAQDRGSDVVQWGEKDFSEIIQKELAANSDGIKALAER